MKAMLLKAPNTAFEPVQLPDPIAGPGEAVAQVITCGAGLTIQHIKAGRKPAPFPRVIGHEITGEIVSVGPGVSGLGPSWRLVTLGGSGETFQAAALDMLKKEADVRPLAEAEAVHACVERGDVIGRAALRIA